MVLSIMIIYSGLYLNKAVLQNLKLLKINREFNQPSSWRILRSDIESILVSVASNRDIL